MHTRVMAEASLLLITPPNTVVVLYPHGAMVSGLIAMGAIHLALLLCMATASVKQSTQITRGVGVRNA